MRCVDRLMKRALTEKVFPGGVLLVIQDGRVEFFKAYGVANIYTQEIVTEATIFDLASLTKPLATTLGLMKLLEDGALSLDTPLANLFDELKSSSKAQITVEMLLRHTSGYPAYRPYYEILVKLPLDQRKEKLRVLLFSETLENPIGIATLYSDLGFMVLARIVEQVAKMDLDRWVQRCVYQPLGLKELFFVKHFENLRPGSYAATEVCPFRQVLLSGVVHDDNAHAVGGVCGHAGLFGTAADLGRLLTELLDAYSGKTDQTVFSSRMVQKFFSRSGENGRPLGFDVPTGDSSSGRWFSKESVGHLGFTGTSFWVDLKRKTIVILLTNRVHPTRNNDAIRQFRPTLHDAVMVALGNDKK